MGSAGAWPLVGTEIEEMILSRFAIKTVFLALLIMGLPISPLEAGTRVKYMVSQDYSEQLAEIQSLMKKRDYDQAMSRIKSLFVKAQKKDVDLKAWLYLQEGKIHRKRRHFHYALEALDSSRFLKKNKDVLRLIKWTEMELNSVQHERSEKDAYTDSRNTGMAKKFIGPIQVAYIYLDDQRWSRWSGKNRSRNRVHLNRVIQWYREKAERYGVSDLTFNVRYFILKPRGELSVDEVRNYGFYSRATKQLVSQLGFKTVDDFYKDLKSGNPDTQIAIVFHANNDARSFARSCRAGFSSRRCHHEFAMVTSKVSNWTLEYAQAHEILHLFGAKDLYNIRKARDYAVTDVMNYISSDLTYSDISPITAWAIGWQNELPKTPFKVEH